MDTYVNDRLVIGSATRIDLAGGTYTLAGDQGPDLPPGGTILTCTRAGLALDCTLALRDAYRNCRDQIDAAVAFRFAMTIAEDGSRIVGSHPWTLVGNDECNLREVGEGGPALAYRYELTRLGAPAPDTNAAPDCDPFEDDNCPDPLEGLVDPGDNE